MRALAWETSDVTVYRLGSDILFPPPREAETSGLLAVGGDLSPERILEAYRRGIFPWYSEGQPILWFSPDPRFVLRPDALRVSRSLRRTLRRGEFEVRADTAFEQVVRACAHVPRPEQDGTWITDGMQQAYCALHELGYAHSAEAWLEDELVGGLYGISLGSCFFGESMFALRPDASKVAFVTIVRRLESWGVDFIDCQVYTDHLAHFGAGAQPRSEFLEELEHRLEAPTRCGKWVI